MSSDVTDEVVFFLPPLLLLLLGGGEDELKDHLKARSFLGLAPMRQVSSTASPNLAGIVATDTDVEESERDLSEESLLPLDLERHQGTAVLLRVLRGILKGEGRALDR